jgi:hypothetical protein
MESDRNTELIHKQSWISNLLGQPQESGAHYPWGDPRALPERQQKFDIFGSELRLLFTIF